MFIKSKNENYFKEIMAKFIEQNSYKYKEINVKIDTIINALLEKKEIKKNKIKIKNKINIIINY